MARSKDDFVKKEDRHIVSCTGDFGKFAKSAHLMSVLNVQEG